MIERQFLFGALIGLFAGNDSSVRQIAQVVRGLVSRGYSREHEFEADRVGIRLTRRAGHGLFGAVAFMERLRAAEGRDPSSVEVFFRTHPATIERLQRVRELVRGAGARAHP
jgi:predicted Zn-dependent protease